MRLEEEFKKAHHAEIVLTKTEKHTLSALSAITLIPQGPAAVIYCTHVTSEPSTVFKVTAGARE